MKNHNPSVDIIILNWNGWRDTLECLNSIIQLDYKKWRITIIDNHSTDNSVDNIEKWINNSISAKSINSDQLTFIKSNVNGGYAAGNNIGLKKFRQDNVSEYFWILNNDTICQNDSLTELVKLASEKESRIGLIGSVLVYENNKKIIQAVGGKYSRLTGRSKHILEGTELINLPSRKEDIQESDYPVGASLFSDKKFLDDVGLMNEIYFLYCEELDWNQRALKKKLSSEICIKSIIFHKEGASTGAKSKDPLKRRNIDFYTCRSQLIYASQFNRIGVASIKLVWLIIAIKRYRDGYIDSCKTIIELTKSNTKKLLGNRNPTNYTS